MSSKPMASEDKQREQLDDAIEQLKHLQEENARLAQANEEKDKEIAQLKAEDEGWLITVPNPGYDGVTLGLKFNNGQAFIPKKAYYKDYDLKIKPVKDTTLKAMGYNDEEIKAFRERENLPSSHRLATQLERDFGYVVEFFGLEKVSEVQKRVNQRSFERAEFDKREAKAKSVKALVTPQTLGG